MYHQAGIVRRSDFNTKFEQYSINKLTTGVQGGENQDEKPSNESPPVGTKRKLLNNTARRKKLKSCSYTNTPPNRTSKSIAAKSANIPISKLIAGVSKPIIADVSALFEDLQNSLASDTSTVRIDGFSVPLDNVSAAYKTEQTRQADENMTQSVNKKVNNETAQGTESDRQSPEDTQLFSGFSKDPTPRSPSYLSWKTPEHVRPSIPDNTPIFVSSIESDMGCYTGKRSVNTNDFITPVPTAATRPRVEVEVTATEVTGAYKTPVGNPLRSNAFSSQLDQGLRANFPASDIAASQPNPGYIVTVEPYMIDSNIMGSEILRQPPLQPTDTRSIPVTVDSRIAIHDASFVKVPSYEIGGKGYLFYLLGMEQVGRSRIMLSGIEYYNGNFKPRIHIINNVPHVVYLKVCKSSRGGGFNCDEFLSSNAYSMLLSIMGISRKCATLHEMAKSGEKASYHLKIVAPLKAIEPLFGSGISNPMIANDYLASEFEYVSGLKTPLIEQLMLLQGIGAATWLFIKAPAGTLDYDSIQFHHIESETIPTLSIVDLHLHTQKTNGRYSLVALSIAHAQCVNDLGSDLSDCQIHSRTLLYIEHPSGLGHLYASSGNVRMFHSLSELAVAFAEEVRRSNPDLITGFQLETKIAPFIMELANSCQALQTALSRSSTGRSPVHFPDLIRGRLWFDAQALIRDFVKKLPDLEFKTVIHDTKGPEFSRFLLSDSELATAFSVVAAAVTAGQEVPNAAFLRKIDPLGMYATFEAESASSLFGRVLHVLSQESILDLRALGHYDIIPTAFGLAEISNTPPAFSFASRRALRNEILIMREFVKRKLLLPERPRDSDDREKESYVGGLVLDPIRGFYDQYVVYLDFASLYPSIVQEFNLDFTTIPSEYKLDVNSELPDYRSSVKGVLPTLLESLVMYRRGLKAQLKSTTNPRTARALEVKQRAVKLIANSMYGTLGYRRSRFYTPALGATITAWGRQILEKTRVAVEKMGLLVIYGDTDSLFVGTSLKSDANYAEAIVLGQRIVKQVNSQYKSLELEIEGIFSRLLITNKKKYAGALASPTGALRVEVKGLEQVRRDWCQLSKRVGSHVVNLLMDPALSAADMVSQILAELRNARQLAEGSNIKDFVITKQLTKPLASYALNDPQPHIAVARTIAAAGSVVATGSTIEYVIVEGAGSLSSKARHPNDIKSETGLKPDATWYIRNQLLPPLSRLLSLVIPETTIATMLGIHEIAKTNSNPWLGGMSIDSAIARLEGLSVGAEELVPIDFDCGDCMKKINESDRCAACVAQRAYSFVDLVTMRLLELESKIHSLKYTCDSCDETQGPGTCCTACGHPGLAVIDSLRELCNYRGSLLVHLNKKSIKSASLTRLVTEILPRRSISLSDVRYVL